MVQHVSPSGLLVQCQVVRWLTPPAGDVSPSGLRWSLKWRWLTPPGKEYLALRASAKEVLDASQLIVWLRMPLQVWLRMRFVGTDGVRSA